LPDKFVLQGLLWNAADAGSAAMRAGAVVLALALLGLAYGALRYQGAWPSHSLTRSRPSLTPSPSPDETLDVLQWRTDDGQRRWNEVAFNADVSDCYREVIAVCNVELRCSIHITKCTGVAVCCC
jgi:hypothetical protein